MPGERDIISVNYVSPLVLRKEFENLMDNQGAVALEVPNLIKEKQVIFWNTMSMLFVSFTLPHKYCCHKSGAWERGGLHRM